MSDLEVYVAYCKRRQSGAPVHWMILYYPEGESQRCTWLHVVGGPTEGYELKVMPGKRQDSFGIERKEFLGIVKKSDEKKMIAQAKTIPMQRCQRWTVACVKKLESKGILPSHKGSQLESRVEPADYDTSHAESSGGSSRRRESPSKRDSPSRRDEPSRSGGSSRHESSRHGDSRHESSRHGDSRHESSRHGSSRHESSRHGDSRHGSSRR